jgi:Ca2+-binding EF-hand superfamily protein
MRNVTSLALAALLASAALLALSRPLFAQQTNETLAKEWFVEHDRNHDGYITLDEVMGYEAKRFKRMAPDDAGRLREDQYCAGIPGTNTAEIARCHTRFTKIDTNNDAYITLDEIQAYYGALLQSADQNQDGKITWDEFKAVAGSQ